MRSGACRHASSSAETVRNTDHLNRIRYLLGLYTRKIWSSIGRVPLKELFRTQFPFLLADAPVPPMLSVELTNHCNLRCGYCTNPTSLRARGIMGEATFARLVNELQVGGVYFVGLCGNGEPTLHPRFVEICLAIGAGRTVPFRYLELAAHRRQDCNRGAAMHPGGSTFRWTVPPPRSTRKGGPAAPFRACSATCGVSESYKVRLVRGRSSTFAS